MSRSNRTKLALLGFLSWGPMSGYDIRKLIDGSISNFWNESYGRIYPMLAELVTYGLASVEKTESQGGRPRNVYTLTKDGRDTLKDWLDDPECPTQPPRDERLLKLFFGAQTSVDASIWLIETFMAELEKRQADYAETRRRLEEASTETRDRRYWLMTLRYGELKLEAELAWSREILEELNALASE